MFIQLSGFYQKYFNNPVFLFDEQGASLFSSFWIVRENLKAPQECSLLPTKNYQRPLNSDACTWKTDWQMVITERFLSGNKFLITPAHWTWKCLLHKKLLLKVTDTRPYLTATVKNFSKHPCTLTPHKMQRSSQSNQVKFYPTLTTASRGKCFGVQSQCRK